MNPITATQNTAFPGQQAPDAVAPKKLDSSDFMMLLTKQLTHQDPLKPMEDTQFLAQMASFTSLEQMQSLNDSFASFASLQRMSATQSYLGKNVTVFTPEGEVSGPVSSVGMAGNDTFLTIGGHDYSIRDVTRVSLTD